MTTEQATREILQSPDAPRLLQAMNEAMEQERRAREEFYERIEPGDKWEFINGEIVMHSPARREHNTASLRLVQIFSTYLYSGGVGEIAYERALASFPRNDYEPDICYFRPEKIAQMGRKDWKYPIPDLIVEILSPSTEANDRGVKFRDYAANGVEEYWIVDPEKEVLEQYLLESEGYELTHKAGTGSVRSRVLTGLELPVLAIFDDAESRRAIAALLAASSEG